MTNQVDSKGLDVDKSLVFKMVVGGLSNALGWETEKYPFTLELITQVAVGNGKLYRDLCRGMEENKRLFLITGPYGAGKSFTLKYLIENSGKDTVHVYLTGDYSREEVIRNIVVTLHNLDPYITKTRFLGLFKDKVKVNAPEIVENMLTDYVNNKLGDRQLVLIWDDIQRVRNADLVGLCVLLLEHTPSKIILCGLKEGIGWLENEVSFLNRGMDALEPEPLNTSDLKELVQKRIEWASGSGYKPFTEEAIDYLATRFQGGRDLLNVCNELFVSLEGEYEGNGKIPMIDLVFVEKILDDRQNKSTTYTGISNQKDIRNKLSNLEKLIFDLLIENESKTSPELVGELGKDRGTIAKTVKRMMSKYPGMILVEKVEGKRKPENSYRIVQDIKRLYAAK